MTQRVANALAWVVTICAVGSVTGAALGGSATGAAPGGSPTSGSRDIEKSLCAADRAIPL